MNDQLFQLDEVQLWRAGAVTLPTAANRFTYASGQVHRSAAYEDAVFSGLGGELATLKAAWTGLRNELQDNVLNATYNNLVKAGEALIGVAEMAAETDGGNAAKLNEAKELLENDEVSGNRPPAPFDPPPSSDDPAPPA